MLKPSKALISSGGTIQYWWAYSAPVKTPTIEFPARQRRSLHTKSVPPRKRPLGFSSPCRYHCPHHVSKSTFYNHRRRSYTSETSPKSPQDPSSSSSSSSETYWPILPSHKQPTPYDILSHPTTGSYNKRRFTHLVKLYHPDSCPSAPHPTPNHTTSTHPSHLPSPIRIERYHLLIQAHTLLSDPTKRAAYDRHGAGWASTPSLSDLRKENTARGWAAARDYQSQTPFHCATWEDWEAWWAQEAARRQREDQDIFANDFSSHRHRHHPFAGRDSAEAGQHDSAEKSAWWVSWVHSQAQYHSQSRSHNKTHWSPNRPDPATTSSKNSNPKQQPYYTSNGLFMFLVAAAALTGVMYELDRAGKSSSSVMKEMERKNKVNRLDLVRRRRESQGLEDREGRVGRFLKERH